MTPYSDYGSLGQYFISGAVTTSALKAAFTFTTADLTAVFTDASTDSSGTITNWAWDFGDGYSSTMQHPSHTFAASGTYTVTLTVTDSLSDSAATSRTVTAMAPNQPPAADFSFGASGLAVTFTDASTDADGTIASWLWNFGDGLSSTLKNPVHTYAAGGSYTVTLTVTDNRDGSDTISKGLIVTAPPAPPAAPSSLAATVVTSGSGKIKTRTLTLKWQDNSQNESGFVIQKCTQTTSGRIKVCNFADYRNTGADITAFSETLTSGTFKYRVRAWNANGSSAYSNEVKVQ